MKKIFVVTGLFSLNFALAQKIYWQDHDKLTWNDFKGPVNLMGGSNVVAHTNCGWEYYAETSSDPDVPVKITVKSVFNKEKSWRDAKRVNNEVLLHEQKHFDIAELFARKLRKEVAMYIENSQDYKRFFKSIYAKVSADFKKFQSMYDRDTRHGMNKEVQAQYNEYISNELEKLKKHQ